MSSKCAVANVVDAPAFAHTLFGHNRFSVLNCRELSQDATVLVQDYEVRRLVSS